MQFKDDQIKEEFENKIPAFLIMVVISAYSFSKKNFNKEMIVTRVLEKIEGSSGIHEAHLAVDLRDEFEGIFTFSEEESKALVDHVNAMWPRFDDYKTMLHHNFNEGPTHFHIQISHNMDVYIPK